MQTSVFIGKNNNLEFQSTMHIQMDSKKDAHKKSWCQIPHLIFKKCFNQT